MEVVQSIPQPMIKSARLSSLLEGFLAGIVLLLINVDI